MDYPKLVFKSWKTGWPLWRGLFTWWGEFQKGGREEHSAHTLQWTHFGVFLTLQLTAEMRCIITVTRNRQSSSSSSSSSSLYSRNPSSLGNVPHFTKCTKNPKQIITGKQAKNTQQQVMGPEHTSHSSTRPQRFATLSCLPLTFTADRTTAALAWAKRGVTLSQMLQQTMLLGDQDSQADNNLTGSSSDLNTFSQMLQQPHSLATKSVNQIITTHKLVGPQTLTLTF